MLDKPITDILRPVRIILPDDPISRAASLMKAYGLPELPVINYGRVVGLIRESDLLPALARGEEGRHTAVSQVMRREPVMANKYMTLGQVADIFAQDKAAVLPVVDEFGSYVGTVARTDVMAVLGRVVGPQTVRGMATPLGVHLTTGTISAGAGSLGLFLTGVSFATFIFISSFVIYGLSWVIWRATGIPVIAMLGSPALPVSNPWDVPSYIAAPLQMILMFLLLRFSPLAGYHAAEHQVVHTMEQGEDLVPEIVKQMPRVHPRCGTNILVAASVFLIITGWFSGPEAVLLAMLIVIVGWRTVGGWFQHFVTTRPPNDKHVANGVKAGKELLDKFQAMPHHHVANRAHIWNMGFPQVIGGMILAIFVFRIIIELLGLPSWFMLGV